MLGWIYCNFVKTIKTQSQIKYQPSQICLSCNKKLEIAYNFKKECDESVNATIEKRQAIQNTKDEDDFAIVSDDDPLLEPMFDGHQINARTDKSSQLKCSICDRIFKSTTGIGIHMQRHNEKKLQLKCLLCNLQFLATSHYKKHLALYHWNIKNIERLSIKSKLNLNKCQFIKQNIFVI